MSGQTDLYHKLLGIPAKEQPPTHYRLLGLAAFESDHDVIDAAADRQMIYLRTLRNSDAQQLLNEVARARICLLDRTKKAEYDRSLLGEPGDCGLDPGAIDRATTIEDEDVDLDRELSALAPPIPDGCKLDPVLAEVAPLFELRDHGSPFGPYSASQILEQGLAGQLHRGMDIRLLPDGKWGNITEWQEFPDHELMGTFSYLSPDPAMSQELSSISEEVDFKSCRRAELLRPLSVVIGTGSFYATLLGSTTGSGIVIAFGIVGILIALRIHWSFRRGNG